MASFFQSRDIPFTILDSSPKISAAATGAAATILGKSYLDGLEKFDVVFRSPGVRLRQPIFEKAAKSGTLITSLTQLFFDLCPCPIIGITGTKGKGTTSSLVAELLAASGQEVFLGGNIGLPALDFLDRLGGTSKVVLELSSFQLQDLNRGPAFACVLNFWRDHLDYHASEEEYRQAKLNLVKHQDESGVAVFNADDERVKAMSAHTTARKFWFSLTRIAEPGAYLLEGDLYLNLKGEAEKICAKSDLRLRGDHNVSNVLAAAVLASLLGVKPQTVKKVVTEFAGLPHHRLEFCGEVAKTAFYNDSLATIPEAAQAAIAAFSEPKILILGGSDKGAAYEQLARAVIFGNVRGVVVMGEVAEKIRRALSEAGYQGDVVDGGESMSGIVDKACQLSKPGDVVLLSPAAASFGMFTNYEDRGRQFKLAVEELKNNAENRKK